MSLGVAKPTTKVGLALVSSLMRAMDHEISLEILVDKAPAVALEAPVSNSLRPKISSRSSCGTVGAGVETETGRFAEAVVGAARKLRRLRPRTVVLVFTMFFFLTKRFQQVKKVLLFRISSGSGVSQ